MGEPTEAAGGFTVLDGAALVLGAAVASVHMRDLVAQQPLSAAGWALAWLTFTGLAATAGGPFILLVRRLGRRSPGPFQMGDVLWGVLGLPWVVTVPLRPGPSPAIASGVSSAASRASGLYGGLLWLGLVATALISCVVLWRYWARTESEGGPEPPSRPLSWSERVGVTLAIAWPLQWGFGLVVLG